MVYMARTQSSTASKPLLSFIHQNTYGYLADVEALSYAVFDLTTPANELSPVAKVAKTAINLDAAPAGRRLGTGYYYAPLTIGADWTLGLYKVVWYYDTGAGEVEMTTALTVTSADHGPPDYYVSVQDLYDTGLDPDEFSVAAVRAAIKRASELIDRATGRHFAPVHKTLIVDGRGGPKLRLREPIIAVEYVSPFDEYIELSDLSQYSSGYIVYNRHIRLGMRAPDDRNNPKIELGYASRPFGARNRFPDGSQDTRVKGVFGYTEPDGSPYGKTPDEIVYVAKLIALLYSTPAASDEAWFKKNTWKVTGERTRDQEVRYNGVNPLLAKAAGVAGFITGDDEIDSILLAYRVSPGMTGA